jgi:predicted TIM-barrel fold metal-dependent hydrolase
MRLRPANIRLINRRKSYLDRYPHYLWKGKNHETQHQNQHRRINKGIDSSLHIRNLGFCGALVNGFSQVGEGDSALYYDLPQYRPFWATVQHLDVPFYLHPRDPLLSRQQCYDGYRWLAGSPWGFAVETSIHALRLMASGLFDEYPKLKIVLGHLGEGLSFGIWRVDNPISRGSGAPKAKLPMSHYQAREFLHYD